MSSSRRMLLAVPILLAGVLLAIRMGRHPSGNFLVFHTAGARFLQGQPLYPAQDTEFMEKYRSEDVTLTFKYAPLFGVLMAPLSLLPPVSAQVVWTECNLLLLVLALYLLRELCPVWERRRSGWGTVIAAALMTLGPLQLNFVHAQTNVLWFTGFLLSVRLCTRHRARLGGVVLGMVGITKVAPLFLAMYPAIKGQWKWLGGAVLGVVVAVALPWTLHGPHTGFEQLRGWAKILRCEPLFEQFHPRNQSLRALVITTFSPSYGPQHFESREGWHFDGMRNFLPLQSLERVRIGVWLLSALLVGTTLIVCIRKKPGEQHRWLVGELSLFVTTMLLISPYTLRYHLVWLMLPSAWMVSQWRRLRSAPNPVAWRWFLVGICWQALFFALVCRNLLGRPLFELLYVFQVYTWGMLGTYLFLVVSLWTAPYWCPDNGDLNKAS